MERALHPFNESRDIVERNRRLYRTEVPRRSLERSLASRAALARQPETRLFIHDLPEGTLGAVRFRFELGSSIIFPS